MSPKHYAQGINVQQGRAEFNNSKLMKIYYSLTFAQKPLVKVNAEETENLPKYRLWVYRNCFYIRFQTPYTGVMVWEASL